MHKITKKESIYTNYSHCKTLIQYHIIWCPKFRYSILKNDIKNSLYQIIEDICMKYKYQIKALEIMDDHIHLFISAPQTVAPCDIVKTLKSISAIELFKEYPKLKKFYQKCGQLWSKGYFISTIGEISTTTVKQYIENQNNN